MGLLSGFTRALFSNSVTSLAGEYSRANVVERSLCRAGHPYEIVINFIRAMTPRSVPQSPHSLNAREKHSVCYGAGDGAPVVLGRDMANRFEAATQRRRAWLERINTAHQRKMTRPNYWGSITTKCALWFVNTALKHVEAATNVSADLVPSPSPVWCSTPRPAFP